MNVFQFIPGYTDAIYDTGREPAFIMMLCFILTFLITRGYTRLARTHGWGSASFGGVHTHHLVFGLITAFTAGALEFAFTPEPGAFFLLLAAAFGSGVALVLDEFALIFHLKDVYWEKEGRKSIDAIIIGMALGGLFLLQVTPLGAGSGQAGWLIVANIATNLPIVIIAAFKGKMYIAIFGVFIPSLALFGAIRLAKPNSAWSRRFYKSRPKKLERSRRRRDKFERRWQSIKERAWDIIGGKIGRPGQH